MVLPNYKNGSIVNLMSSIGRGLGKKMLYPDLKLMPSSELRNNKKENKNIILILIDGMGYYDVLRKSRFMKKHCRGKITSVFPSTTAAAITTIRTGVAPQQHAITGWFMNLKEIGVVAKILPFSPRYGGKKFSDYNINMKDIADFDTFTRGLKTKNYIITKKEIAVTDYSGATNHRSIIRSYNTINGYYRQIKKAVKEKGKKFVYAYFPMYDGLCHEKGVGSKESEIMMKEIDEKIEKLSKEIDAKIIITADHGMADIRKENVIWMDDHPKLKECLTLPLCGELRAAYCYVKPSKAKEFERYVKNKFEKYCVLMKSEKMIKKGFFGLYKQNPRLIDRIGDYTLIMKPGHIIKDKIIGEIKPLNIGNHGGVSKEEMFVPLIVV